MQIYNYRFICVMSSVVLYTCTGCISILCHNHLTSFMYGVPGHIVGGSELICSIYSSIFLSIEAC